MADLWEFHNKLNQMLIKSDVDGVSIPTGPAPSNYFEIQATTEVMSQENYIELLELLSKLVEKLGE